MTTIRLYDFTVFPPKLLHELECSQPLGFPELLVDEQGRYWVRLGSVHRGTELLSAGGNYKLVKLVGINTKPLDSITHS